MMTDEILREHSLFMAGGGKNFVTYCRGGGGGATFFSILFGGAIFFLTHYFINFFFAKVTSIY